MKIFSSQQIREIDAYTISHEPVASVDLMERAAGQLFKWISGQYSRSRNFMVFAGPGNNGGDGLALARMLGENGYSVEVYLIRISDKISADLEVNLKRLEIVNNVVFNIIDSVDQLPLITSNDIIIDAIFGSGLARPVDGLAKEIIMHLNKSDSLKISIDIPSGLFGEDNSKNSYSAVIEANVTLSFQFPKLSFMFAENSKYVGDWHVLPIGLDNTAIRHMATPYFIQGNEDVLPLIKKRNKFDHKGNFGHGLLIAGSQGKMGAAVLGAHAALRTGIGLLTCHIPACGCSILQTALPEAMTSIDRSENFISETGLSDAFNAVGAGPGIGTGAETGTTIFHLLSDWKKPLVLDADALNIIAMNKDLLSLLPPGSVITPHPKEFERLAGKSENGFQRLQKQIEFSREHKCIVVLKGAYTSVSSSDGSVSFNSTGNPGMASGGSGDVLTGMILSLLAQGYSPQYAAVLGVYLHGIAGDIAAEEACYESIIASDIINCIGKAFNRVRGN